jgi:peptidyl-prolyl cis-trans isomerase A (cyclophilin A)
VRLSGPDGMNYTGTMRVLCRILPSLGLLAVSCLAQTPATAPAAAAAPAKPDGLYATIQTSMGSITVKLFEKEAPITVKNFQDLAMGRKLWTDPKTKARVKRPLYNGTIFHRVIPGFMIQGGDPTGTGMGGTDVIKDEFSPGLTFNQPGRLAMANAGPGTGSCQFFITEVATPHLNGLHTIFGQVVENQDLVKKITGVPAKDSRPITPVVIQKITFERVGAAATPAAPAAKPATPATKPSATPAAKPAAAPAKK